MHRLPPPYALASPSLLTIALLACAAGGAPLAGQDGVTPAGVAWWSEGTGPAVVLVHAFSLDHRMWDDLTARLRDRYRVIRLDLRGHGLSPEPDGPYSSYLDVASVMETAGVTSAWLVGLSSGSQVALDFALEFPDRVKGLVLVSPSMSGYLPRGSFEWFGPVMEAGQREGPEGAARAWLETPLMTLEEGSPGAAEVARLVMENAGVWGIQSNPDQAPDPPAYERPGEVSAPALVVTGSRDLVDTRTVSSLLGYCLPRGRVEMVSGAGHLVAVERPVPFAELVESFLTEAAEQGRGPMREAPGCGPGEDLMGPGSLAPLARLVGGSWRLGETKHRFTWGPGRRALTGTSWTGTGASREPVAEVTWYWHPGRQTIEGRGVAVGMGIDLFEYDTRVVADTVIHTLRAFGPGLEGISQTERWIFLGPDSYRWELLGEGGEIEASDTFVRAWEGPAGRE